MRQVLKPSKTYEVEWRRGGSSCAGGPRKGLGGGCKIGGSRTTGLVLLAVSGLVALEASRAWVKEVQSSIRAIVLKNVKEEQEYSGLDDGEFMQLTEKIDRIW